MSGNKKRDPAELLRRLFAAVGIGKLEEAATMVAYGADLEAVNDKGWTPLLFAVNRRHVAMVELLLAQGADANVASTGGLYAVHYAAVGVDDPTILKLLIEVGHADVNVITGEDHGRCSPLIRACVSGTVKVVAYLTALQHPFVDLYVKDHMGFTALARARQRGFSDCEFLIRRAEEQRARWQRRREVMVLQELFKPEEGLDYSEHTARAFKPRVDMKPPSPTPSEKESAATASDLFTRQEPGEDDDPDTMPFVLVPQAPSEAGERGSEEEDAPPEEEEPCVEVAPVSPTRRRAPHSPPPLTLHPSLQAGPLAASLRQTKPLARTRRRRRRPKPSQTATTPHPASPPTPEADPREGLPPVGSAEWNAEVAAIMRRPEEQVIVQETQAEAYRRKFASNAVADTLASLMRLDNVKTRDVLQTTLCFL